MAGASEQYELIKIFMIAVFVLLLCLFVAVNFGLSRDDIVGRVLNKINIGRYVTRHHEGVLTYKGETPLTQDTSVVELAVFLTAQFGVVFIPSDFKYARIEIKDGQTHLSVVMSRRCRVFYGKCSFLIDVPVVKIATASIILVTDLGDLLIT